MIEELAKKNPKHKTLATQRSLKRLRDNGWIAWIVEKWIPPRGKMKFGIRQDVWGFGDVLACRPAEQGPSGVIVNASVTALVQCFPNTGGSFAAHRRKILAIPEHKIWLASGNVILLHGWAKQGPRGKIKRWTLRQEVL